MVILCTAVCKTILLTWRLLGHVGSNHSGKARKCTVIKLPVENEMKGNCLMTSWKKRERWCKVVLGIFTSERHAHLSKSSFSAFKQVFSIFFLNKRKKAWKIKLKNMFKRWKRLFWLANGMQSTCLLVKIHNRCGVQKQYHKYFHTTMEMG